MRVTTTQGTLRETRLVRRGGQDGTLVGPVHKVRSQAELTQVSQVRMAETAGQVQGRPGGAPGLLWFWGRPLLDPGTRDIHDTVHMCACVSYIHRDSEKNTRLTAVEPG